MGIIMIYDFFLGWNDICLTDMLKYLKRFMQKVECMSKKTVSVLSGEDFVNFLDPQKILHKSSKN